MSRHKTTSRDRDCDEAMEKVWGGIEGECEGWLWTFVMSMLRLSRWSGILTTDPTCFLFPGLIIRLF